MANKYVGAAQFVGEKIIKPIVKSFTKKQKTTGKTTNPFERKKMRSDRAAKIGQLKVDLAKLKGGSKKLQTSIDEVRAAMREKARVKKMGGGMMGRRFGMKKGSNGLVGKQKNIDVAAPFGKITGADFKKLRNK